MRTLIRQGFAGGARAAAALFGCRIAAGPQADDPLSGAVSWSPTSRLDPGRHPQAPGWLNELDTYEGADELSFVLHSELGDLLAARIDRATPVAPDRPPFATRRRHPRTERRGRCPRTRR